MNKTEKLFRKISKVLAPPPKLAISDWADEYRFLSRESSAEPGKWYTSRAEYQREIMNAISDPKTERVVLMTSAQIGKALSIDTPILTKNGFKNMGDIEKGDIVFDEGGNEVEVLFATEIMKNRQCYEITFSDGNKIVADADHKWTVNLSRDGSKVKTLTLGTKEMSKKYKDGKRNLYSIPVTKAVKFKSKNLLIKPYTLGLWLGDGSSYSAQLTLSEKDIELLKHIESDGYNPEILANKKGTLTVMTWTHWEGLRKDTVLSVLDNML